MTVTIPRSAARGSRPGGTNRRFRPRERRTASSHTVRHVGQRSDDVAPLRYGGLHLAGASEAPVADLTVQERDPEIGDPGRTVAAHEDVVWLEVAMDEPGSVHLGQAAPGGDELGHDLPPRPRFALEPVSERATFDALQGDEQIALDRSDVVDNHDIGMAKARHRARFAQQANVLHSSAVLAGANELDGDIAFEGLIPRRPDNAHPSSADHFTQLVPIDPITG
jgi:hypothetical protein